jgi:hypothetical protein
MNREEYSKKITYIQGNSLEELDMERCSLPNSKSIVLLADKFSPDHDVEDTHTILQAMFIKTYLETLKKEEDEISKKDEDGPPPPLLCMQLLAPDSLTNYEMSLSQELTKNDQIVCIESTKLSLLAKSCLCPGLVVLITNLIKSSGEINPEVE